MIQHWTFARGGAWRNPKPTGGLYVCEQCRLDARSGNDSTLTMQAVTAIELAPTDVCADCGARRNLQIRRAPYPVPVNVVMCVITLTFR